MEGLEISIKKLSEVFIDNPTSRIDSEYFMKDYLEIFSVLNGVHCEKVESLTSWVTQGPNPVFNEEGIPCLTGRNISGGRVNYSNSDYVSTEEYQKLSRYQLMVGDTLITLKGKGSIGKVGYVTDNRQAIFSRDIGVIRPNAINSAYLNAYILSKYGAKIIARGETGGTGQSTLATSYLKGMDLPRFTIEDEIGQLVQRSEALLVSSQDLYQQAENLLLEEVGYNNIELSKESVNIKSFTNSFLSTGRFDAEYYQPKFEQLVKHITSQNYDKLKNLVEIKKSIEPGSANYSEEGLPFLRVSDYTKFEMREPEKKLTSEFCAENAELIRKLKLKKDTILFSKDGSVGIAHLLQKDMDMVTSGAILHLTVMDKNRITPEYLTLALNSNLVQLQAERDAGGSIILHWRVSEIEEVVIPIIDYSKQLEISKLVKDSFSLRIYSDTLLDAAKYAVEIAIEQGEKEALKFMEQYESTVTN